MDISTARRFLQCCAAHLRGTMARITEAVSRLGDRLMKARRLAIAALLAALLLGGLFYLGLRLESGSRPAPEHAGRAIVPTEETGSMKVRVVKAPKEPVTAAGIPAAAAGEPEVPSGGAVTGVILDRYGAPVSGARVKAARAEARTDHQGEFMLEGIPGGAHTLTVSREGFAAAVVPEVEPETDLSITLARLGGVSGRVVDAGAGLAVEDFRVRVSRAGKVARDERFDGSGGAFVLVGLAPGTYLLEAATTGRTSDPMTLEIDDDQVIEGIEIPIGSPDTSKGG